MIESDPQEFQFIGLLLDEGGWKELRSFTDSLADSFMQIQPFLHATRR